MSLDPLSAKQNYFEMLNGLFKVDINSESLKGFLESIVAAINQQAKQLKNLQTQIDQRSEESEIEKNLSAIADSVNIGDAEFAKIIGNMMSKPKPEATGKKIEDGANKVCNKLAMIGPAFSALFKRSQGWEQRLNDLANEIPKKLERQEMKQKVKKTKTKLIGQIDELKQKLGKQADNLEKKFNNQQAKLEQELREIEKKTLWKIQDCESLLSKRVSGEFVESALKGLDDKLKRDLSKLKDESFGGVSSRMQDIEDKLKSMDEGCQDKNKRLKVGLKELEDTLTTKFVLNEKMESFKRSLNDKTSEMEKTIIIIERRGDANSVLEQARDLVRGVESKLNESIRNMNEINDRISHLMKNKSPNASGSGQSSDDCLDPHKLCLLEAGLKRLKDEFNEQKRNYGVLDDDMRRKFDNFEHKMLANLNLLNSTNKSDYNRDEIIGLIERAKVILEEKVKALQRDLEDIKPRVSGFLDLEKKMKKKFREISESTELSKKIYDKADQADVNKANNLLEERIRQISDTLTSFRRDFDSVEEFCSQMNVMLQSGQQEAISVITGNTKYIANRCAACGTKGRQNQNSSDLRGVDGKIYKVDVSGVSCYDNHEVFDIYPHQISPERIVQGVANSSPQKQQVVSFKEKPGSIRK